MPNCLALIYVLPIKQQEGFPPNPRPGAKLENPENPQTRMASHPFLQYS